MKEIRLKGKRTDLVALVDDEDFDRLNAFDWYPSIRKRTTYAKRTIRCNLGRTHSVYMHTDIIGGSGVDHLNHNGLDNRRANLRKAKPWENAANVRKPQLANGSTSRFIGVYWSPLHGKWAARVSKARKKHFAGYFQNEEDAARARDALAIKLHGEFACLNFPALGTTAALYGTTTQDAVSERSK